MSNWRQNKQIRIILQEDWIHTPNYYKKGKEVTQHDLLSAVFNVVHVFIE